MEKPYEGMKDIDDVLRSVGREAGPAFFREHLANAKPAPEYLLDELKAAPEAKRSEHADGLARIILKYPPIEQEALKKRMAKALGVSLKTVEKTVAAVRPAKKVVRRPAGDRPPPSPANYRKLYYRWSSEEGLEKIKLSEVEGRTVEESEFVANFLIRIERMAMVVDDLEDHREYECRVLFAKEPPGERGRSFRIEADRFGSPHQLSSALAGAGNWDLNYSLHDLDFIRNASSAYSKEKGVVQVRTVRYIGYAKKGGGYITPSVIVRDGRVVPAEELLEKEGLRCELPEISFDPVKLLDLAIIPDDTFKETLTHIVRELVGVQDLDIGRASLGHTALAPVFGRLRGYRPYVLAVISESGHGKSTCVTYFQSFFGPRFTNAGLPNWGYTPKALERAGHYFKDALYLIDDFKRAHFTTLAALKDAMRVLQNYADASGRNRLSRSSKMLPSTRIRGMVLITGEDLPEGETSNLARMVPLPLAKTKLTPEQVKMKRACDAKRQLYAGVMARYIAWTQRKGDEYLQARADELFDTFLADADVVPVEASNKPRILQNLALNTLGFVLWLEFAGESGVLTEAEAARMAQEHFEFLKGVFLSHVQTVSEERPFMLFLRDVRAMVDSEVVRLAPVMEKPGGGFMLDKEQKGGNKPLLGYIDDRHVYLLYDAVFKEVGEYRARGRVQAGEFSRRAITNGLLDNGVLVPNTTKSGTNSVKKHRISMEGSQKHVLKMKRSALEGPCAQGSG